MKIREYVRIFVTGRGNAKIAAQKELAAINGVTVVDMIDQADYLFLAERSADAQKREELAYAKELGLNILTTPAEVQRLLAKTDLRLAAGRIKEDISDEI